MRRLVKGSFFIVLMLMVSMVLTGCDTGIIDDAVAKINDAVTQISDIIKGITDNIDSATSSTSSSTSIATSTTTISTTDTSTSDTGVASETETEATSTIENEPGTNTADAKACAEQRAVIKAAVVRYNKDHSTMMNTLDCSQLVTTGYLKTLQNCPSGGMYTGENLNADGAIKCSIHGTEYNEADSEATTTKESPGD